MQTKWVKIFDRISIVIGTSVFFLFILQSFVLPGTTWDEKLNNDDTINDNKHTVNHSFSSARAEQGELNRDSLIQEALAIYDNFTKNPASVKKYDCSGFVLTVYKKMNYSLPRSSCEQYIAGSKIRLEEACPGDLLFFRTTDRPVSHVAIYLGDSTFIHSSLRRNIRISSLKEKYWKDRYVGAADMFKNK